jgi:hypothetical protein
VAAFRKLRAKLGAVDPTAEGRAEATGQGLFGLGDEIGAVGQAMASQLQGGNPAEMNQRFQDTYHQALNENQDVLEAEHEREPWGSRAIELAAAVPATLALPGGAGTKTTAVDTGLVSRIGGVKSLTSGMKDSAISSLPAGAAFGFGASDADNLPDRVVDTAAGAAFGMIPAAGLRLAGNALSRVPFFQQLATKMHRSYVTNKIHRLQEAAGDGPIPDYDYAGPMHNGLPYDFHAPTPGATNAASPRALNLSDTAPRPTFDWSMLGKLTEPE